MAEPHHDIYSSGLGAAEQLLNPARSGSTGDAEARDESVLRRVLSTPLIDRLSNARSHWETALEELCSKQDPPIHTVRDLLLHPFPPVGVLIILKNAAKASRNCPDGPLSDHVSTALYLSAIGIAWLRCGELITTLDIHDLGENLSWAARQSWDDPEIVEVLESAAEHARSPGQPDQG
ncbi:MAG: hypothetical protein V5A84_01910 [Planctomycetota bacterium]